MNSGIWVIVFLLALTGCAKEQDLAQKSASVAPVQAVGAEAPGMNVAPPVAVVQEMRAQIQKPPQQKTPVNPAEGAEEIIAENRWGFSVYDPHMGITQYYSSRGLYLGQR